MRFPFVAPLAVAMTLSLHPLAAQESTLVPLGGEEAATIVDRFFEALHARDTTRLEALVTPGARWSLYAYGPERLEEAAWLPVFWQYPLLELGFTSYPPTLTPEDEVRVTVSERMSSGSLVIQKEMWRGRSAGVDETHRAEFLAAYKLRAGRIDRVWYLPNQNLEVPAGVRPIDPGCREPTVWFEAGHNNPSTPDGLYARPASVLRTAGYEPRTSLRRPLTPAALDSITTLVIVNPLPDSHAEYDRDPDDPPPSAFGEEELETLETWVRGGGRLLLIADHDPWPPASADLAARFGARFRNGAAIDTTKPRGGGDLFSRAAGTLLPHPITDGRDPGERVDSVRTFLGQAFEIESPLEPILLLHDGMKLAPPGGLDGDPGSWTPVGGMVQGAAGHVEDGRVVLLGEAWLFRYLDDVLAHGNTRFLLNLVGWLTEGTCAPEGPETP